MAFVPVSGQTAAKDENRIRMRNLFYKGAAQRKLARIQGAFSVANS
jgi:hypothetical protein